MLKKNDAPAFQLAMVRKDSLSYCEPLPKIIKAHGPASLGCVALSIGKCFNWIVGELNRTIATLQSQLELLQKIAASERRDK